MHDAIHRPFDSYDYAYSELAVDDIGGSTGDGDDNHSGVRQLKSCAVTTHRDTFPCSSEQTNRAGIVPRGGKCHHSIPVDFRPTFRSVTGIRRIEIKIRPPQTALDVKPDQHLQRGVGSLCRPGQTAATGRSTRTRHGSTLLPRDTITLWLPYKTFPRKRPPDRTPSAPSNNWTVLSK